jgi:hypothetical protein
VANFFQAPPGEASRDVLAGTGELRAVLPLERWGGELFGTLGGALYGDFDPSYTLLLGARAGGRVHRLDGTLSLRARSPRMEVGDTLGFADVLFAAAGYALRPVPALEIRALAEADWQSYGRSHDLDNRSVQAGGSVRFLGLGSRLSPEMGVTVGGRDVRLEVEDYRERTLWLTLRSAPVAPLYLTLRYRARLRNYSCDEPGSRNLGREDDRRDLTLTVDLALGGRWSWSAYLSRLQADSNRDGRGFRTLYLLSSLGYRVR